MARKSCLKTALTVSVFFAVVTLAGTAHTKTIYVDDDAAGANDGSSWTDAYKYLQDALLAAASGDDILVAQGIYKPMDYTPLPPPSPPPPPPPFPTNFSNSRSHEVTTLDRTFHFCLKNGVSLKGGYAGAGYPDPDARDIEIYETILSGDLNSDDDTVGMSDNSFCVIRVSDNADTTTVLDGLVITAGFNETDFPGIRLGAGLMINEGAPTIVNCTFTGNYVRGYDYYYSGGAGIYAYSGSPVISNCTFRDNHAEGYFTRGAGIWSDGGSPVITDCKFIQNTVVGDNSHGAGVLIYSGSPVISNCIFRGNRAEGSVATGAGLYSYRGTPVVTDCEFIENATVGYSSEGAGVCANLGLIISNCTFRNNHIEGYYTRGAGLSSHLGGIVVTDCEFIENTIVGDDSSGAGLCNGRGNITVTGCSFINNFLSGRSSDGAGMISRQGVSTITRCIFIGNHGPWYGGGLYTYDGSPNVISCLFVGNSARHGGGFLIHSEGEPNIVNCTFTLNTAEERGGGICDYRGTPTVVNTILWANSDEAGNAGQSQIFSLYGSPRISNSWIAKDPLFLDHQNGDYHLLPDSPCIDAGDPNYMAEPNEMDLDDKPRIIAGRIDIGAYEFQSHLILYVDSDATGANDGSSWTDAFNFLQDALAIAYYGDEIRVAQGIYKPDQGAGITPGDREATFQLIDGVTIKGGYAGFGQPDPNVRDIELYETTLSGDLEGNDGPNFTNDGENSYHVVTGSGTYQTAILDGFTITAGKANGSWLLYQDDGGGLCNYAGSPTIGNCTFTGNWAGRGGGIYNESSSPTLFDCTIRCNAAIGSGSGMFNRDSSNPTVTNCTFSFNVGLSYHDSLGVGMYNYKSNPILSNCTFAGNSGSFGAGMCNYHSDPKLTSCTFIGNKVHAGGGGMANLESSPILVNCTFTKNWSDWYGVGGMENCCSSNPILTNCILWNDMPGEISDSAVVTYSNVQGGWPGTGNIDTDPYFVSPGYLDTNGTPDKHWDDFWVEGDYHLLADSPCIDAGDPNYIAEPNETDLDGKPRILDGDNDGILVVDMGAYEYRFKIFAEAKIVPKTINLASEGNRITCYIWLPEQYNVADIEPNSVLLEDDIQPDQFSVDEQQQVATAIFNREDVLPILEVGDIDLKITGKLTDGTAFEAKDTIKVINKAGKN